MNMRITAGIAAIGIALPAVGAAVDEAALKLADAMNMQQLWAEKTTGPTIEKYVEKVRGAIPATVNEEQKKRQLDSLRVTLHDHTSWERIGKDAFVAAYAGCDERTLVDMRRVILKEITGKEEASPIVASFQACAKDANRIIQERFSSGMQSAIEQLQASALPDTVSEFTIGNLKTGLVREEGEGWILYREGREFAFQSNAKCYADRFYKPCMRWGYAFDYVAPRSQVMLTCSLELVSPRHLAKKYGLEMRREFDVELLERTGRYQAVGYQNEILDSGMQFVYKTQCLHGRKMVLDFDMTINF